MNADEAIFARLAKLSPADYDRCRDDEAKQLNIRTATLDAEVQKRRAKSGEILQGGALNLADVELWPDAVNGADALAGLAETFSRYVALPAGAADALALWTAHAHCFEFFQCSPRLNISSPEKGLRQVNATRRGVRFSSTPTGDRKFERGGFIPRD